MAKHVYFFGDGKADGAAKMKNLLGGKGANLAEMTNLGIPVPPGFTVTTEVCTYFDNNDHKYPEGLEAEIKENVKKVEKIVGTEFNSEENPLLFSVRSGARASMPGMMDTVLNLGLNDETVKGLIKRSDNERLGYDSYRRFIQMYSNVVLGIKSENFEHILDELKEEKKAKLDTDLTAENLKELVQRYKKKVKDTLGKEFPNDPWEQLWGAVGAVFKSWGNPRAVEYRRLHKLPDDWGTAVNVQAMVFGNTGTKSATGVAFTRDPATGARRFFGEYLINAQGEDVVAGIRTPQPINNAQKTEDSQVSLEEAMPELYKQLEEIYKRLEKHYRDMQDIEFTIQDGKLYMLQTRNGKRTGLAAIRIAFDMVEEGLIDEKTALMRIEPEQLTQLLAKIFEPKEKTNAIKNGKLLAKGLNAGPGAATGHIALSAEKAVEMSKKGQKCVLVRVETSPEDIAGMAVAQGILTARGGMTSHAAVVARGMGKPCVAGCGALNINYKKGTIEVGDKVLKENDFISIDGSTGEVLEGEIYTISSEIIQVLVEKSMDVDKSSMYQRFKKLMEWTDKYRKLGVRTNSDTPDDSTVARNFGAEGIGLCRTEHMFFGGKRIDAVREMILSDTVEGRKKALDKIEPMQREDFIGIFKAMEGLPVTIRFLDPPLHEFLPHKEKEVEDLAKQMGVPVEKLQAKVQSLAESNPMLGHRGCRLGITYPEISEMQTRAVIEAAITLAKEGKKVIPEIMIPLVGHVNEYKQQEEIVRSTAEKLIKQAGVKLEYKVGTMIELPRAVLTADEIANRAEFFSFGTNDLTQTTFGLSRDDAGKFLPYYVEKKILKDDPFRTIDIEGVGLLVQMGVEKGRKARPNLKVGICGEHGGDPDSVEFFHRVGLDYVSCSPYRVPVARLAAARANLREKTEVSSTD